MPGPIRGSPASARAWSVQEASVCGCRAHSPISPPLTFSQIERCPATASATVENRSVSYFILTSMRAVSRLAINHTLKPERRLNFRYVVIDAQEHRLDAETLDVIGSDPMASVDKTFLYPCGPFRNVGTRNHKAVIEYRETDFLPLIEFAH